MGSNANPNPNPNQVRAPPRDFEPEEAMRRIFELGLRIAEA